MSDLLLRAAAAEDRAVSCEREMQRLRRALAEIRDHWACQYDHPRKLQNAMYSGPYGIGVTDGHRCCADIARKALESMP